MKKVLKRYLFPLVALFLFIPVLIINWELGKRTATAVISNLQDMLLVLPPIFILLGLLDEWVQRDLLVKFMGQGSGLKGILIAVIVGSVAAGPLYGAFPVAAVLMRKGASLRNIFIFLGAWSTTKIPMFLFEYSGLGPRFAFTRLAVDIPGIIIIGFLLSVLLKNSDKERIEQNLIDMTKSMDA